GELDGRIGSAAGDPDLEIGKRLRDDVPLLTLPDLAMPIEWLRRRPGLQDQLDRFPHHQARIGRQWPALLVVGDVDAYAKTSDVAPVGQMVADRRVGRKLQRMEERHRPDARSHPDLLGERRRLADHEIGARQRIRRLPGQERAVLANPGFRHAEPVSHDDLLEVLVVAELGDLVVAIAVGENPDLHPFTSGLAIVGRAGAACQASPTIAISAGACTNPCRWACRKTDWLKQFATSATRASTDSSPSTTGTTRSWNRTRCSFFRACGRSAKAQSSSTARALRP